jgi:hypothetical protein
VGLALNQKADLLQGQLDVSSLRNLHWADYGGGQSHFLGFLKTISRPFNILNAIGLVFYRSRAISRSSAGLSGVSLLLLTLDTLGEGGRGLIVFVGIVMLYSLFFIQFNGNLKITKIFSWVNVSVGLRIGLIVVLGLLAFGVWFPVARNPNLSRNFNYFFERRAGVIVTDLGWELENVLGNNIYAVLTSLSYFTNPISTLTFYYRFSDFENWYYLGQYSFPLVSKPVDLVMGNDYSWFQIRQRLSLVPASMGLADNPWATGLRGLLVDFGEIGTVIFLFILGFLSEFMFQKASLYPSDLNIFVLAIFCGLIFVFPLYEFFHSGYFTLPLLIILPISLFQTKG